ncbi:MAG TPA: diguanylate cyclase [Candidatus Saccharicenans sp.]|nr:diguanylate cyclase [Candidatus Saccharicenans sp.]HPC87900.1 diguanylate cyclase [Candidatus Saccharicenans sp.]HPP23732.1 diguanylate cyclase [Candidatus Saccharicenans sp.]HQE64186.1 diguanylate cyclase [Candidatus Saccharicenans sp.]HQH60761.1 diguanylate cyclase [Candidatus Saccharicenans sp.]
MLQVSVLVLVREIEQALKIVRVCEREFQPIVANSPEELKALMNSHDFWAMVVDSSYAAYDRWKELIKPDVSVIIVGSNEAEVYQMLLTWPQEYYLDYVLDNNGQPLEPILSLLLQRAVYVSRIKKEWAELQQSLSLSARNTREIFRQIKEIKQLINQNYLRELEKRLTIETRYISFQKERQKTEGIIRKIYLANDVSSLLGVVPEIKELLEARGLTIYLIEENETLGKHLKPIIWDDTFITHPETYRYVARLGAPDFASAVATYGLEINLADSASDQRYSIRYQHNLKEPLKSILAVPIIYENQIIGVVEVYNKSSAGELVAEGFSQEDQEILRGLSEHIGIAMTKLNLIQYDALTGLLRADPFFDRILQKVNSMSKRKKEEGSFAMVMGDVDWFKHYNDRNGHEAGNRLLQELALIMRQSVREEDLICRYGGEEFLFFLEGVSSLEEACQLTERIRKNIEEHYFPFEEYQPRNNLTMSFGVTIYPRRQMMSSEGLTRDDLKHLVHECDLALAAAKGKETWRLPPSEGQPKAVLKNRVVAYSRDWESGEQPATAIGFQEKLYREKRHFQRYFTSTFLIYKEDSEFKVSKTINLSLGGTKIISEKPLPVSRPLEVVLVLGKKARWLQTEVVYSEKAGTETPTFYTGLRFKDLSPEDLGLLQDYFQEIQKENYN